jgi:hypothetical protein
LRIMKEKIKVGIETNKLQENVQSLHDY